MKAQVLPIEDKTKRGEMGLASLADFHLGPGSPIDARIVFEPQISPYCLDDETKQAVFVEVPPEVDWRSRPFLFLTQYENAQRVITVPFDALGELAGAMEGRFRALITTYSVGRAGGTLLSRSVSRLHSALSLDEPDVFNNVIMMRQTDGSRDAELVGLLHACTCLLWKPYQAGQDTLFIKFRSCSIEIGDLLHKAFPEAKVLFLYRNAETWARSASRSIQAGSEEEAPPKPGSELLVDLFRQFGLTDVNRGDGTGDSNWKQSRSATPLGASKSSGAFPLIPSYIRRVVKSHMTVRDKLRILLLVMAHQLPILGRRLPSPLQFVQPYVRSIPPMKILALMWLSPVHRYLAMHAQGIPMLAVQYETLTSEPEAALRAIFDYCGLPVEEVAEALSAFAEDSQKGTPLSRDRVRAAKTQLAPELLDQVREVLREYPPTERPDFVVPGSLELRRTV